MAPFRTFDASRGSAPPKLIHCSLAVSAAQADDEIYVGFVDLREYSAERRCVAVDVGGDRNTTCRPLDDRFVHSR